MNKQRRNEILTQVKALGEVRKNLESIKDAEQAAFDNLPESLQFSEKGELMEENISNLEEILSSIDEIETALEDLTSN